MLFQACSVRLPAPAGFARPPCTHATRRRSAGVARAAEPELEDTLGVDNLLERDMKKMSVELKEEAFTAFADEPLAAQASSSPSSSGKAAPAAEATSPAQQQQQAERGPASKRADKLRGQEGTPQRAREAIDAGLEEFQAGRYREAVDLFQLSLELPGSGFMRMSGSVREYSCPSEGEENAALYNMACCWAKLGQKESALTVLEALLENSFDGVATIRTDPDLASLRGPELDKLLSKYDGLLAKVFGQKKKKEEGSNKAWLRW